MTKTGNGQEPRRVDFPSRGIITTAGPIKTQEGDYSAFYASTWQRMFLPNGMPDSWAVLHKQGNGDTVVLMIPIQLVTGFIATNLPGGSDVFNADEITLIEIA